MIRIARHDPRWALHERLHDMSVVGLPLPLFSLAEPITGVSRTPILSGYQPFAFPALSKRLVKVSLYRKLLEQTTVWPMLHLMPASAS